MGRVSGPRRRPGAVLSAAVLLGAALPASATTVEIARHDLAALTELVEGDALSIGAGGGYGGMYYHWTSHSATWALPQFDPLLGQLLDARLTFEAELRYDFDAGSGMLMLATSGASAGAADRYLTVDAEGTVLDADSHALPGFADSTSSYLPAGAPNRFSFSVDLFDPAAAFTPALFNARFGASLTYLWGQSAYLWTGVRAYAEYAYLPADPAPAVDPAPAPVPLAPTLPLLAGGLLLLPLLRRYARG